MAFAVTELEAGGLTSVAQTVSSASFTPAANSQLLVIARNAASDHTTTLAWAISDTEGLTWTKRAESSLFGDSSPYLGTMVIWTAPVGASPASMTVTLDPYTTTADAWISASVLQIVDGDETTPIGTVAFATNSGSPSLAVSNGSAVSGTIIRAWFGETDDGSTSTWDSPLPTNYTSLSRETAASLPFDVLTSTTATAASETHGFSSTGTTYSIGGLVFEVNEGAAGAQDIAPTAIASGSSVTTPAVAVAAGAQTITPTAIASGSSVTTASLTPGAVTAEPTPIGSGTAVTSPSVTVGASLIAPTPISSGSAATTPSLATGGVDRTPTPVASGHTLGSPSVVVAGGAADISPTPIGTGHAVTSPTLSPGSVERTPTPIGAGSALATPTVAPGGTDIAPTAISSGHSLASPTVAITSQVARPTPVASGHTLTSPQVSVEQFIAPTPIVSGSSITSPNLSGPQQITMTVIPSGHTLTSEADRFWARNAIPFSGPTKRKVSPYKDPWKRRKFHYNQ